MRFSIRKMTLLGIGGSILVFFAGFAWLQQTLLRKNFTALEHASVTRNVRRACNAIADELSRLDDMVIDWARWDDTAHILQGKMPVHPDTMPAAQSLASLRLTTVAFIDNAGNVLWAHSLHAAAGGSTAKLLSGLERHLQPGCPLLAAVTVADRVKGLVSLPQGILLTASSPILDAADHGAKRGTLVMGRLLDKRMVADIGRRLALTVRFDPLAGPLPPALARLGGAAPAPGTVRVTPLGRDEVAGEAVLADLDAHPALRVIVRQPRSLLTSGQAVINEANIGLAVGGVLLTLLLFAVMERRVLQRLAGLTHQVTAITGSGARLGRVNVPGDDELGILATRINALLCEVERARQAQLRNLADKQGQEASLRQILDSIQAGVLLVDASTCHIREINRFAAEALGRPREALLGKVCDGLLCPSGTCRDCSPAPPSGVGGPNQCRLQRADGSTLPILRYALRLTRDGQECFLETFIDIHELHETREALAASEAHLRRVIDTLPIGIYQASPTGRCTLVNPSLAHMMGYTDPLEMLAVDPEIQNYYVDKRQFQAVKQYLVSEGSLAEATVLLRRVDGDQVWVRFSCLPVQDPDGLLLSYIGYAQDITQRREAEQELKRHRENLENLVAERTASLEAEIEARQRIQEELLQAKNVAEAANKTKSIFLANMSHEIRTPLNGVLGMLQLLADSPLTADQKECLDAAVQAANRLTSLLSDILDLSRVEANKLTLRPDLFSFESLRQSVLSLFRTAAWKKGLKLTCTLDPVLPPIALGDEARLRQILFNLVGNALKFTESGRVWVEISPLPDADPATGRYLFMVGDTGIGISDEHVATIFSPFVQAEQSATRTFQGAGLGLSIVRKLVSLMHGTLTIDNLGEEPGTVFYVSLPLGKAPTELPAAEDMTEASAPTPVRSARILLVEDEPISCKLVQDRLARVGYALTTVGNGQEALDQLGAHPFDLVIMDIQMPILNGVDATRRIRTTALPFDNTHIPIIAMTAYAMAGDKEAILSAGMNAYLAKPVELKEMVDLIHDILENPAAFPPGDAH